MIIIEQDFAPQDENSTDRLQVFSDQDSPKEKCQILSNQETRTGPCTGDGPPEGFTTELTELRNLRDLIGNLNNTIQENSDKTEQLVESNEQLITELNDKEERWMSPRKKFSPFRTIPPKMIQANEKLK